MLVDIQRCTSCNDPFQLGILQFLLDALLGIKTKALTMHDEGGALLPSTEGEEAEFEVGVYNACWVHRIATLPEV